MRKANIGKLITLTGTINGACQRIAVSLLFSEYFNDFLMLKNYQLLVLH